MAIVERGPSFYVKVHRGAGRYEHVGSFRFEDHGGKRGARRAAQEAETTAMRGRAARRRRSETCEEFADRWLVDYRVAKHGPTRGRRKSDKTITTYGYALRPFKEHFAGVRLSDVDRPMARAFAAKHPTSVVVVARNLFADAHDDGLIPASPFTGLQLETSTGRRETPVISRDELDHLADVAVDELGPEYGPQFRAAILFSAFVGPRAESLFHLRWEDVDLEQRTVFFRKVKFDKPYTAVLLPEAIAALGSFPRRLDSELVFHSVTGKQFSAGSHWSTWSKVRSRAGLSELDWHGLRHWAGHHFYKTLGFNSEDAGAQLGHKNGKMIEELYGHGQQGALERLRAGTAPRQVVALDEAREASG